MKFGLRANDTPINLTGWLPGSGLASDNLAAVVIVVDVFPTRKLEKSRLCPQQRGRENVFVVQPVRWSVCSNFGRQIFGLLCPIITARFAEKCTICGECIGKPRQILTLIKTG